MPMTTDQASNHIGEAVVYTAPHGAIKEDGVITSVKGQFVFVKYGDDKYSKATHPANLALLADLLNPPKPSRSQRWPRA